MTTCGKARGRRSALRHWWVRWWVFWRRAVPKDLSATVRGLWSLPKAAPALMRHIGAYIELAGSRSCADPPRNHRASGGLGNRCNLRVVCGFPDLPGDQSPISGTRPIDSLPLHGWPEDFCSSPSWQPSIGPAWHAPARRCSPMCAASGRKIASFSSGFCPRMSIEHVPIATRRRET